MLLVDLIGALANLMNEIIGELLQRAIRTECDRGQGFRARKPALQHLARHLEDGLGEGLVELQFVGTGGIVKRELAGADHGVAAVLDHAADATPAERDQNEILIRAGNPRRRAVDPLLVRRYLRADRLSE